MKFIKGFTFGFMTGAGSFADEESKKSLKLMKEKTASDTVIIALGALQETAHSEYVDYKGEHMPGDEELIDIIEYAKELELRVILKPLVNCKNGVWRAHINFFDVDVPCEPKWKNWFQSYTDYQLHYAEIAEKTNCEMLIIGCEMVQAQRKSEFWRYLIKKVRTKYSGLISYNTDKYQEEHVDWWDEVDVISSSGYYPINDWDKQLIRIKKAIEPYNKPFFFAEAGCPSRTGSAMVPNDWTLKGDINLEEQEEYYKVMFDRLSNEAWIEGFGLWDWHSHLYDEKEASKDDGYAVYGKPACKVIHDFYSLK
ncbi:hypothetical protein HMPREF1982_01067 [Clostridiales bacterium oral taxon 876 str. F0540]|nr:hypothetical protein HMPREF1982_01067 [Clostridiales bacterium oral taxon 876 str. F0540]